MSQDSLKRGIIGKEFLISEDILISNYNPFQTTNTAGPAGLKEDTVLTGKLYLFNKKEFKEPTKEEFQNIKSIAELAAAPYKLIPEAVLNSLSVSILTKWNDNLDKRTFELVSGDSIQDINPTLSVGLGIEEFIKDNARNLLGTFVIFVADYNISTGKANKKNYTDLPTGEQFFMYMIPSEHIQTVENFDPETNDFLGISFSFQDASKKSIILNNTNFIEQVINEKTLLTSSLNIPGDTNYTRTQNFYGLEFSFVYSGQVTDPITELVLNDTVKQSIVTSLKESLINDSVNVSQELFNLELSSPKLRFTLIDNKINVNIVLTNTDETIIIPETPMIGFGFNKSISAENLILENITIKGTYLLPLKFMNLEYNISNGTSGFFELQQLASNQSDNIVFSTGGPDLDLPNRKVYMYGGKQDTSSVGSFGVSNTLWRSNVQNDGSLEGFTQIGTNTLNLASTGTYTYIDNPDTGTGWVYVFFGQPHSTTTLTASNKIKRAPILEDGTIGSWEDIFTLDNFRFGKVIGNPEDKKTIYCYGNLKTVSNTNTLDFLKNFYVFKIQEDGSLTLEQTYVSTKNHSFIDSIILKDPIQNKQFLYLFGTMDTWNDPSIYKYQLDENGLIIESPIKVGNLDKSIHTTTVLEDNENVYIVGGYSNTTSYKIGARRIVLKYPKDSLVKAGPTNLLNPEFLPNLSFPFHLTTKPIKTKYGYYLCGIKTTNNETGSVVYWTTSNKIIGFKLNEVSLLDATSKLHLEEFNFPVSVIDDTKVKLFPNKLGKRIREELLTNLFVKQPQTLQAYGETIKFVNPSDLTTPIVIREMTTPIALPKGGDIFLKWIEELCVTTNLEKYNEYLYTFNELNTLRKFDIIIPEVVFNILYTKDLYELNVSIFKEYLVSNPPAIETDPDLIINEQFIENVLYHFYKSKVSHQIKNDLTFGVNGLSLPNFSTIEYSSKPGNYQFIFFPQRQKLNKQVLNNKLQNFPNIPNLQNYFEKGNNLVGCTIDPKVPEEEIDKYLDANYLNTFDYFIAPDGNDSNDGRSILTPKKTVGACPAGTNINILLLPGVYNGNPIPGDNSSYNPNSILWNMANQNVYGCGDLTIINSNTHILFAVNVSPSVGGKLRNIKFNMNNPIYNLIFIARSYYNRPDFSFINCEFDFNGKNGAIFASAGDNYGTLNLINCSIQNINSYHSVTSISSSFRTRTANISTQPLTELDNILLTDPDRIINVKPKTLIDNIRNNYTFKPMYTLIPIGNEGEENVIQLETTNNITTIPNLDYKL